MCAKQDEGRALLFRPNLHYIVLSVYELATILQCYVTVCVLTAYNELRRRVEVASDMPPAGTGSGLLSLTSTTWQQVLVCLLQCSCSLVRPIVVNVACICRDMDKILLGIPFALTVHVLFLHPLFTTTTRSTATGTGCQTRPPLCCPR